jgi:AcrR family transcriptional regulator
VPVSRWAPDARERLETAALDLFAENGYEETTVAQIADRAGLNRATFFRHFADKREVLFGGEDVLAGLFADAIRAASPDATLTECLQAAFAAAEAAMTPQQRAKAAQRVLVVAANSELQERGLLKHARIARSINAALRERGADELTARLGAEVGMLAFTIAVERWMEADNDEPVPLHAAAALSDLQARAAELDSRSRHSALREFSGRRRAAQAAARTPSTRRGTSSGTPWSAGSTGSSATVPSPPATTSSPSATRPPSTSPPSESGSGLSLLRHGLAADPAEYGSTSWE